MTDMRATGRLLEVVAEAGAELSLVVTHDSRAQADNRPARHQVSIIENAARELRRRGDTLVRRDDLRTVLRQIDPLGPDAQLEAAGHPLRQ